jgi:RND family efflux transporter MFP subunit
MKTGLTTRAAGWALAGLALATVAGVSVVVLTGGSRPGTAVPGQSDHRPPARGAESPGSPQAVRVKTIRPAREPLKLTIMESAHVEPYEKADLFAKVAGYLQKVHVDIGDRVTKDQVLADLWIPEMEQERVRKQALVDKARAELGQAEAAWKAAEAMVGAAQAKVTEASSLVAKYEADVIFRKGEHGRYLGLFQERAVQKDVVDREFNHLRAAEAALTAAQAAVATAAANFKVEQAKLTQARADEASAQARLKVAEADLEYSAILLGYGKVTAPYDGVLTQRLVHPGAFIQSAATGKAEALFTIARVDRMRIVTAIREAYSSAIKIGQPATLQVDAARGQRLAGKVARLADALDRQSRTMLVEVELDTPANVLRPGMYGSVTITVADYPDALLLPTSALVAGAGKPSVMVVSEGQCQRREIELGYNDLVRMQITRGLSGDEQVITDGKDSVREGQAVAVVK